MNKLDKIFDERFLEHSTPPSAAAWDRIEAGLSKKNNGIAWMRWAAVLVPATVVAALWLNKPVETTTIAQLPVKEVPSTASTSTPAVPQQNIPVVKPVQSAMTTRVVTPKHQHPTPSVTMEPATEPAVLQPEAMAMEDVTIEPMETAVETTEQIVEVQKPIVLVYTLESVATPVQEAEKPSTFERAVEFARTVKHSDPIGEFRVMKDELFALDLRKKSTKKN